MHILGRYLTAVGCAIGLAFAVAAPGYADDTPGGDAPPQATPFPDETVITAFYTKQNAEDFFLPGSPGVWFLSPSGAELWYVELGGALAARVMSRVPARGGQSHRVVQRKPRGAPRLDGSHPVPRRTGAAAVATAELRDL